MKTILKLLAGLVLLLVIAVAGFLYTFDANSYKKEITELAGMITDRRIAITGDMAVSLYPWIGVKVNGVSIDNTPGFSQQTFATIGQLDLNIKIMPLLQKRLEVDRLVLHDLDVNFEQNASGKNNWSDITGVSGRGQAGSESGLAGLSIGTIDLKNARLNWLDAATGKQFKISKMNLGTRLISAGQPLPLEMKALVESNQPEWMAAINAKTELLFDQDSALVEARGLKLSAKALLPDTEMGKLAIAMVSDGTFDLQTQSAKLTGTKLGMLGLVMAGTFDVENLFSVPTIQGPIKVKTFEAGKLAKHLKYDLPELANAQSLKKISLSAMLKTDFDSLRLDDISARVDQSKLDGFVHVAGIAQPRIRYQLTADQINLSDYLPVNRAADEGPAPLPLDYIKVAALDGELEVGTVLLNGIELKALQIATNSDQGVFNANPVTMQVHGGDVSAAMRLDARKTPAAILTADVKGVDASSSITPLLKTIIGDTAPKLSGLVDADININAKGHSLSAMKASAQGTIKLGMGAGSIQGIDFNYASQSVVVDYADRSDFRVSRTFNDEYVPDSVTEFDSLNASFRLNKGRLVNKDLLMVSKLVNVTGSGYIDLVNARLDYRPEIDMHVKKTGNVRDKLRDHPMMYHASGALGDVSYEFDAKRYDLHMGRLMIQEAKAHRNRQINKKSQNSWQNALSK